MNTEFKDIDNRYDLFWLGMKYEKEKQLSASDRDLPPLF